MEGRYRGRIQELRAPRGLLPFVRVEVGDPALLIGDVLGWPWVCLDYGG
jgi:hypothetical protein